MNKLTNIELQKVLAVLQELIDKMDMLNELTDDVFGIGADEYEEEGKSAVRALT